MRGEGTFAAVRREIAEARVSRSVTWLFDHRWVGTEIPNHKWFSQHAVTRAGRPRPHQHNPYTAVVASVFNFSDW